MDSVSLNQRLSRIDTLWSLVTRAHDGATPEAAAAQQQLLERYGGAIRRYLRGAVRDPEVAEELFQEFACRLLRGGLRGADPQRGRFRAYVKGVLFHLVADHHKGQKRRPVQLAESHPEPAAEADSLPDFDRDFLAGWRDDLLARAWAALAELERSAGKPFHTVLRFRAEHPDLSSQRLAEELGSRLGKPLTAGGVRQTLHRARERFADYLLEEVAHSLPEATPEALHEELIDLGLLEYCRSALERHAGHG